MTEAEANKLLIKAFEEAAYIKYGEIFHDPTPIQEPGLRFHREMRRMLRNPLGYAADYERPQWLRVARTAAAVFLCILMLFGSAMMIPPVRATVERVLTEWYEEYVRIWFANADNNSVEVTFVEWRLDAIPDGYEEIIVISMPFMEEITYTHESKPEIHFVYSLASASEGLSLDSEHYTMSEIMLNGETGYCFLPNADIYPSHLIWFNTNKEYAFHLSGEFPLNDLIALAKSAKIFS